MERQKDNHRLATTTKPQREAMTQLYEVAEIVEVLKAVSYLFAIIIVLLALLVINHWIYIFTVNRKMQKALKMSEEEEKKTQSKDCVKDNKFNEVQTKE